jgi:hypothetical protein
MSILNFEALKGRNKSCWDELFSCSEYPSAMLYAAPLGLFDQRRFLHPQGVALG